MMAVLSASWLLDSLLLFTSALYVLYLYMSSTANYFKDRGIPYLRPTPFVGQLRSFTIPELEFSKFLYNCFPGERFFGYFQARVPYLLVKDPDLVHRIMVKDFVYFYDRGFPFVENDLLSQNLVNLKGQAWRSLRQKLVTTFSTGKLKLMLHQLTTYANGFCEEIEKDAISGEAVDIKDLLHKLSIEVLGSTAFGLDFSQGSPQGVEFVEKVKDLFILTKRLMTFCFLLIVCPKVLSVLKLGPFPAFVTDYFLNLTKGTKEYRKKNNIKRNDYFQILLSMQEAEESGKSFAPATADDMSEEDALVNQMASLPQDMLLEKTTDKKMLTDEAITAHTFVFLLAGSHSVPGTVSFLLYHVAKDVDIERRIIEEIREAVARHGWTYNAFREMAYIDQVIQETLRLYPIVAVQMRQCTAPYNIPGSNLVLEQGSIVVVPVGGLQNDPLHYPSPDTFNPDRFAGNNYKPSPIFMPFGDGPRICIAINFLLDQSFEVRFAGNYGVLYGAAFVIAALMHYGFNEQTLNSMMLPLAHRRYSMRFAILQMKVFTSKILSKYTVHVSIKTIEPLTLDRKSMFPRATGGLWLNFKKRTQKIG